MRIIKWKSHQSISGNPTNQKVGKPLNNSENTAEITTESLLYINI